MSQLGQVPRRPRALVSLLAVRGPTPEGQVQRFRARIQPAGERPRGGTTAPSVPARPAGRPAPPLFPSALGPAPPGPPAPSRPRPLPPWLGAPGAAPAPPSRLAAVRGRAAGPGPRSEAGSPVSLGHGGAGRRPQPAGPFGHRPVGPLTLHHLLRLLLAGTAFSRHVGCSSPFRNLSPQALQPIRAPSGGLSQPMESQRRGLKPRRACAAPEPHG